MTDMEIERLLKAIDTEQLGWIHYEAFCDCIFGALPQTMSQTAPLPSVREDMAVDRASFDVECFKRPLPCDKDAMSRMTSSTIPPEGESSSRTVSDELERDVSCPDELPLPGSGAPIPSEDSGLNPLLILELAALDGARGSTPDVSTERISRTPSAAEELSQRASLEGRQSVRLSARGLETPRRMSAASHATSQTTELPAGQEDGEITGCPSLAASMSSISLACPATSSTSPPWGRSEGQCTVALVSCASDPNEQFRSYMEDGQKVIDPFLLQGEERWGFFAVYDGHGGRQAVDYCEERLHELVRAELQSLSEEKDVEAVLQKAFQRIDAELALVGAWRTGCTATVALVHRTASTSALYCANVGDSRAVLYGSVGAKRISNDHRATDPREAARIAEEGGLVRHGRVGGQLIVSRSLGDHHLKGCGVSCIPEVHECSVGGDCALVIASDGLWDGLQDEEAGEVVDGAVKRALARGGCVQEKLKELAAQDLVEAAKEKGSRDNILALVIFF